MLAEEKQQGNIKSVEMNSENVIERSIKQAYELFLNHKKNVEGLSDASIDTYQTAYKYLLFYHLFKY